MSFAQRLLILLAFCSAPVLAAPDAVVDAVQMPAWLDRDGRSEPLAPGVQLKASDRVRTGAGSRVYLKLAEGSTVKIGENGALVLQGLGPRSDNVFTAALDILRGAFRFTTDALAKVGRRAVTIRVDTVTAGVRGTDLWGKADADRDLVCLIEGRISVSHKEGPALEMKDPLTFFVAPKDQAPEPVARVAPEKLKEWAAETDIAVGAGAARRGGKWRLDLARAATEQKAVALFEKARLSGYAAELRARSVGARREYDVQISHLGDKREAQALAMRLAAEGIEAKPAR